MIFIVTHRILDPQFFPLFQSTPLTFAFSPSRIPSHPIPNLIFIFLFLLSLYSFPHSLNLNFHPPSPIHNFPLYFFYTSPPASSTFHLKPLPDYPSLNVSFFFSSIPTLIFPSLSLYLLLPLFLNLSLFPLLARLPLPLFGLFATTPLFLHPFIICSQPRLLCSDKHLRDDQKKLIWIRRERESLEFFNLEIWFFKLFALKNNSENDIS